MNRRPSTLSIAVLCGLLLIVLGTPGLALAQDPVPVVHAVLFFSPNCGHCEYVITTHLPPLFEKHGNQLDMLGIDVTQPNGLTLYQNAIERFEIPAERLGVPTLIVGDVVLVGSQEIPELFPGLIERMLEAGGQDWPDIPGLEAVVATPTPAATPQAGATAAPVDPTPAPGTEEGLLMAEGGSLGWREKFALDPVGNGLSVAVLAGMVAALAWALWQLLRPQPPAVPTPPGWMVPVLCLVGFVVAGYLAYVETTNTLAVCGPVGDCNTVQQSEYARLFGLLPIGVLGLAGYVLIVLAWMVARFGRDLESRLAAVALLGMALAGTLFSIYLTFLEPFVIGATCAWCLTSAIVMTLLLLASVAPGRRALRDLLRVGL